MLIDNTGFTEVTRSFELGVDPDLQIDVTNQLNVLDSKFGMVKNGDYTITAKLTGESTTAQVAANYADLTSGRLDLNQTQLRNKSNFIK